MLWLLIVLLCVFIVHNYNPFAFCSVLCHCFSAHSYACLYFVCFVFVYLFFFLYLLKTGHYRMKELSYTSKQTCKNQKWYSNNISVLCMKWEGVKSQFQNLRAWARLWHSKPVSWLACCVTVWLLVARDINHTPSTFSLYSRAFTK